MRIGKRGTAADGFVQELWFDGVPVRDVWYEGVKFYPDERTVVRDVVTQMPEDCYWVHAVDACRKGLVLLVAEVAGRMVHLFRGDGSLPVLRWVDGAWRADESAGLLLSECQGGELVVRAAVPERAGSALCPAYGEVGTMEWDLPLLPGTRMCFSWWGGQRGKWCQLTNINVQGFPGGRVYLEEYSISARGRGDHFDEVLLADVDATDRWWRGSVCVSGIGGLDKGMYPVYPAFEMEWRMPVLGVTLQRKKD